MKQKNDPPGRLHRPPQPQKPHRVIAPPAVEAGTNVVHNDEESINVKQPPATAQQQLQQASNFTSAVSIGSSPSSMHDDEVSIASSILGEQPEVRFGNSTTHVDPKKMSIAPQQRLTGAVSVASSMGGRTGDGATAGEIGIFKQDGGGSWSEMPEDEAKDVIASLFYAQRGTALHPTTSEVSVASSNLVNRDKRSRSGNTVYSTQPVLQKLRSNPTSPQASNATPIARASCHESIGTFYCDDNISVNHNNSLGIATLRCMEPSSIGPTTVSSLTRTPSRVTFTTPRAARRERSASDHEVVARKPTHRRATSADLPLIDVRRARHRRSTSDCQLSLLTEDMGNVSVSEARRRKSPPACIVPLIVDTDVDSDSVESALESIEPLLELLETHQADAAAANLLLDELFDRAVCEDCELIQRAPDVVATVSKVMESNLDDSDLQHRALGLLVQLLEHPDYSAGSNNSALIITQIMSVVGRHEECPQVLCAGFWCLRLLLTTSNGQSENQSTAATGVVLKAMRDHAEDANVQQQGISVLAALSNGHPENTARIISNGGIMKLLVDTMKRHADDPSVQKWGCVGLAALLNTHSVVENREKPNESHAAIVHAMQRHELHAEVQLEGCLGLAAFVNNQSLVHAKEEHIQKDNPDVLCESDEQTDSPSFCSSGIEGIVRAMYIHEENAIVQQRGSFSLGVYSSCHYQTEVADAAGIEASIHAMKTHKENAEVQQWGCFALGNLCNTHSSNQAVIASMKGFHLVLGAMRRHKESAGLQTWGCFALQQFADDQNKRAIIK